MSWVILDDTDPELQYQGTWSPTMASPDINQLGNWGAVFQNTLHVATGNSKVSYTFNGTQAQIIGTTNHHNPELIASYTCLVDGISQRVDDGRNTQTNNHCFCDARGLSPSTPHTIQFSADIPEGSSFLFDKFQYRPSPNTTFSKAVLAYDSGHPDIQYDGVWKFSIDRTAQYTQVTDSKATLMFKGISLQWYAVYYSTFPRSPSTATWSVDGVTPQSFPVGEIMGKSVDGSHPFRNQLLFQTGVLEDDVHILEVVFKGDASTVPLSLESVVVQDASWPQNQTSGSHGGSQDSEKSGGLSIGAKVAIGLGVTIVVLILLLSPFIFKKWNHKRKKAQYNRERPIISPSSRSRRPVSSRQNLIAYPQEHLPLFISPHNVFEPPPEIIHNPFQSSSSIEVDYIPAYNDPSSLSTVQFPNPVPYPTEVMVEEPLRDRKTSSSTIASISNPFRTLSTSASSVEESTSLMTNPSTSTTGAQSNAWSHNHLPSFNQDNTTFNTSSIPGRIGELRDVKRSTPTFVYLQNDEMLGSTTTIDTMPVTMPVGEFDYDPLGYNITGPAAIQPLDPLIPFRGTSRFQSGHSPT